MSLADFTSSYRAKIITGVYGKFVTSGQRILDIGCGTGIVADEIAKNLNVKVEGCDIDNYLKRKLKFKKMPQISKLPYKNKQFDYSMFNDVLHHTKTHNQLPLILESARVSKKVLIFELKPTIKGKILDFVLNKIHHFGMEVPFTYRTRTGWINLFKRGNLKYKSYEVKSPFWYPFKHTAFLVSKGLAT